MRIQHSCLRIPEYRVRTVWLHQNFSTSDLRTSDGRRIQILSPGVANADAGPDFINAAVRIGGVTYRGDVEIHRIPSEWEQHHHDSSPHYNRVILHVVLSAGKPTQLTRTQSRRRIPLLVLYPYLDSDLESIPIDRDGFSPGMTAEQLPCRDGNASVPATVLRGWIMYLARDRLEMKMRRFNERLLQLIDLEATVVCDHLTHYIGSVSDVLVPQHSHTRNELASLPVWEQLLYEGIMECLGYSKNQEAFLSLAQSMRLGTLREFSLEDEHTMMSLLFGAAGLLPSTRHVPERESRHYVRALKHRWNELRPYLRCKILYEGDWKFFRLRPANFPTARLAAMCFLLPRLFHHQGFGRLLRIVADPHLSIREQRAALHMMFHLTPDRFWQRHLHLRAPTASVGVTLGKSRITDLLMNAVLPITLLYGRMFDVPGLYQSGFRLYRQIPLPHNSSNGVIRHLRHQLLRDRFVLTTAMHQQGAIQLFRRYCAPGRCSGCRVGRHRSVRVRS